MARLLPQSGSTDLVSRPSSQPCRPTTVYWVALPLLDLGPTAPPTVLAAHDFPGRFELIEDHDRGTDWQAGPLDKLL